MRLDPELRGLLPILAIVLLGFVVGLCLLVVAVLTGA